MPTKSQEIVIVGLVVFSGLTFLALGYYVIFEKMFTSSRSSSEISPATCQIYGVFNESATRTAFSDVGCIRSPERFYKRRWVLRGDDGSLYEENNYVPMCYGDSSGGNDDTDEEIDVCLKPGCFVDEWRVAALSDYDVTTDEEIPVYWGPISENSGTGSGIPDETAAMYTISRRMTYTDVLEVNVNIVVVGDPVNSPIRHRYYCMRGVGNCNSRLEHWLKRAFDDYRESSDNVGPPTASCYYEVDSSTGRNEVVLDDYELIMKNNELVANDTSIVNVRTFVCICIITVVAMFEFIKLDQCACNSGLFVYLD